MDPEIQALQDWIDALLDEVQLMLEQGDTIPDELMDAISDAIEDAYREIAEIEAGNGAIIPPTPPPPVPPGNGLNPVPHESSNINAIAYDPNSRHMLVQFHGPYPNEAGPVYQYDDVPANAYEIIGRGQVAPRTSGRNRYHAWQRNIAPSHGASVNALLKEGGHAYRRVA